MNKPRELRRSVTLADVARKAGVSRATAARALGRYGTVSAVAREQVLAAAEELGYRPNELARSMITGRSGTIGVVVGDIENPFVALAVRGIGDVARTNGFHVILANSGEDVDEEKAAVDILVARRVDGLIVTPASFADCGHLLDVARSGRPLALLDRLVPGLEVDTVVVDDRAAAEGATRLLIDAGHRRIAYVTAIPADDSVTPSAKGVGVSTVLARIQGFLDACGAAGIEKAERYIRFGAVDGPATSSIVGDLMAGDQAPSAIFSSDSMVALEVFKAVRSLDLVIPADVSLVSFHDADWTQVTTPPISVVAQPVYDLGREVATMLVRRILGPATRPERRILPTRLIVRGSVDRPAAGRA